MDEPEHLKGVFATPDVQAGSVAFQETLESTQIRIAVLGSDSDDYDKRNRVIEHLNELDDGAHDVWKPEQKINEYPYSELTNPVDAERVALIERAQLIFAVTHPGPSGVPTEFSHYGHDTWFQSRTILFYLDDPAFKASSLLLAGIQRFPDQNKHPLTEAQYKSCNFVRRAAAERVQTERARVALSEYMRRIR